ncbi:M16 family metallopeptidase [Gelidibacter pelagius]|uniref:Insulinase family protein n=1 Tax=Gelidibacter pelagius TaxID=2819985 RepID=A0ABS3SXT1_9FLAO|nr:insulinase family protein [Gelidibacter pelagius]MBO3100261.1 insulinase family protein [Gelidibacter pelagius]
MTHNRIINLIFLTWSASIYLNSISAQQKSVEESNFEKLDQSIRHGKLPNGFTYFIKPLKTPQPKLSLNFYVKAGFYQEDEDQVELAHFVEHMAFKGGDHIPNGIKNDPELLEKNDVYRNDITATASLEFTKYVFNVQPNNFKAFNFGLLFFHDIASSLKFTERDIDNERGVMIQELIFRNGSNLSDYYIKETINTNLFPCRNEIGNLFEHYKNFKRESLVRYYKDWYRPDLMALTVVGNIKDIDSLEQHIINSFIDIERNRNPRKMNDCKSTYFTSPKNFLKFEKKIDQEKSLIPDFVEFQLFFRDTHALKEFNTFQGVQREISWKLLTEILNSRFLEATNMYNNSFKANSRYSNTSHPSALSIKITTENKMQRQALEDCMKIMLQTKKFGVTDKEWTMAKSRFLQRIKDDNLENSQYWQRELEKHIVYGEEMPSDKQKKIINWLSALSLSEFNELAKEFLNKMPEDIIIIAPSGHKALSYSEKQVRKWIEQIHNAAEKPFHPKSAPQALIKKEILADLKTNDYIKEISGTSGATELILNNGVKVSLKSYTPSSGAHNKNIMVHGFSPYGASSFPKEDYFSAINAPLIVKHTGVGGLDKFQIERFLADSGFKNGVRPYIEYSETGIKGDAPLQNLENLLQLVYLHFKEPGTNKAAFKDWVVKEKIKFRKLPYSLHVSDFLHGIKDFTDESSETPMGTIRFKGISKTNMNRAHDIYKQLYGSAKDFTFIISGDFKLETVVPLVKKYLGNLPNSSESNIKNINGLSAVSPTRKPVEQVIHFDYNNNIKGQKYGIRFLLKTNDPNNWQEEINLKALSVLTNYKLKDLRYARGLGLYNFGVDGKLNNSLSRYEIDFIFDTTPSEFEDLRTEANLLINEIKLGEIDDNLFMSAVKHLHLLYNLDQLNKNSQTIKRLHEHYRFDKQWVNPIEMNEYVKSLTLEDIINSAQKYFNEDNKYEFSMMDGNDSM